jgi:PAS domain S-box-containing protein
MYHKLLQRQLKKYLGENPVVDQRLQPFLAAISESYMNYEKDRELSEHSFKISENEYQNLNDQLKQLSESLETKVKERTRDLEDIAQFPLENPNPIFRISFEGEILFRNPISVALKKVEYNGISFSIEKFWKNIVHIIDDFGNFQLVSNNIQYLFYYKKVKGKNYFNFYGADVTETNTLRLKAQENYHRLNNFLESTDDAYFIVYANKKVKNLLTTTWKEFFGFDDQTESNLFLSKSECVISESPKAHYKKIIGLKLGDKLKLRYQIKNKITGENFWLSEEIYKQYDIELDDIFISGRISNITQEHLYEMQMKESEERFRNLMDNIPVMAWVSDSENKIIYSNQASDNFLGYSVEKAKTPQRYLSKIHPEDRESVIQTWKKNLSKKQPFINEYRVKGLKNTYYNLMEKGVPRFYADGTYAGYIGVFFDLTNEKKYQETLFIEKEKLKLITVNSPDIILLTNELGIIEYVSPTSNRILGFTEKEMLNQKLQKFICTECRNYLEKIEWLNHITDKNNRFEFRMRLKNGHLKWVESVAKIIPNVNDDGYKILFYNTDIDKIKRTENYLIASEHKYRALFENMYLGVMEVDLNEKILWVNQAFEKMMGYSFKYLKGRKATDVFIADPNSKRVVNEIDKTRRNKIESIYEIKVKKSKGEMLDLVISGSPVIDIEGKVKGSIGIHWDVTHLRKMEKMIEEEKINHQNEIMKATINAEEKQREIFGNELHDGVGHMLTYTSLFLQMAGGSDEIKPELIFKAKDKVEEALNEIRRISRNMVPPALVDLGLKEAIIELFNQFADMNQIDFNVECKKDDLNELALDAQKSIYRIVQELIINTIKHANAKKIKLVLKRTKSMLLIVYKNDGKPFNINKIKKGNGLNSITNRAYFYSGSSKIESSKMETIFTIELPLKNIIKNEQ